MAFNRSTDPVRPAQPTPPRLAVVTSELTTSVIGNDLCILGDHVTIITQGILQVDGQLQADLHGVEVTIGEKGKVEGTVVAQRVSIAGEVNSIVRGVHVELMPTAKTEGEIHHQTLTIAEGAHFEGKVRRPQDTNELMPVLNRAAHDAKGYAARSS